MHWEEEHFQSTCEARLSSSVQVLYSIFLFFFFFFNHCLTKSFTKSATGREIVLVFTWAIGKGLRCGSQQLWFLYIKTSCFFLTPRGHTVCAYDIINYIRGGGNCRDALSTGLSLKLIYYSLSKTRATTVMLLKTYDWIIPSFCVCGALPWSENILKCQHWKTHL